MKHHFETLNLKEGASQEDIQAAYERLSKELNPSNNDNQEFFAEEFKKVQEAYNVLSNTSILASENVKMENTDKISKPSNNEVPIFEPPLDQKKKSFFSKENLIVALLFTLLANNVYLQVKVSDATKYAKTASNYASEAADNADNASNNALEAADYARMAKNAAFGNQCSYCP